MDWHLIVDQGVHKGRVIPIKRSPFWIGREAGCHVRSSSEGVGARHCALVFRKGKLYACPGPTDAGTRVNDQPLEKNKSLRTGDSLEVGPLKFVVKTQAPAGPEVGEEDAIAALLLQGDPPEPGWGDQEEGTTPDPREGNGPTPSPQPVTTPAKRDSSSIAGSVLENFQKQLLEKNRIR